MNQSRLKMVISWKQQKSEIWNVEDDILELPTGVDKVKLIENAAKETEVFLSYQILDAEYKPASLDDVIKTCQNLHVEEQRQLKILLKKYEHLFDGTLGEFNLEQTIN
jgi:hypothetical protein